MEAIFKKGRQMKIDPIENYMVVDSLWAWQERRDPEDPDVCEDCGREICVCDDRDDDV